MIWQDWVIGIGQFIMTIALLPTLFDKTKSVHPNTSLPTAAILTVFAVTMFTLGLYLATVTNAAAALVWWLLLIFRRGNND